MIFIPNIKKVCIFFVFNRKSFLVSLKFSPEVFLPSEPLVSYSQFLIKDECTERRPLFVTKGNDVKGGLSTV